MQGRAMSPSRIPIWLLGAGIALIAFSFAWPRWVGGRRAFTDRDAKAYQEASIRLHNRIHAHASAASNPERVEENPGEPKAGSEGADSEAELKRAWQAFRRAQARRDAAIARGQTTARVAKWLGVLTVIAGVVMWLSGPRGS